jgi:hypothetical protein
MRQKISLCTLDSCGGKSRYVNWIDGEATRMRLCLVTSFIRYNKQQSLCVRKAPDYCCNVEAVFQFPLWSFALTVKN